MPSEERPSRRLGQSDSSTVETLPATAVKAEENTGEMTGLSTVDFGFVPIPKRVRYDPQNPAHFGLLMNVIFGAAGTFSTWSRFYRLRSQLTLHFCLVVANLYYCQPLLSECPFHTNSPFLLRAPNTCHSKGAGWVMFMDKQVRRYKTFMLCCLLHLHDPPCMPRVISLTVRC